MTRDKNILKAVCELSLSILLGDIYVTVTHVSWLLLFLGLHLVYREVVRWGGTVAKLLFDAEISRRPMERRRDQWVAHCLYPIGYYRSLFVPTNPTLWVL